MRKKKNVFNYKVYYNQRDNGLIRDYCYCLGWSMLDAQAECLRRFPSITITKVIQVSSGNNEPPPQVMAFSNVLHYDFNKKQRLYETL